MSTDQAALESPQSAVAQPLLAETRVDHFVVNLTGSQHQSYGSVTCNAATIYVSGSSTLKVDSLNCKGKVTIHCVSSSFVHIGTLVAPEVDVNHGYASSMYIGHVTTTGSSGATGTFAIDVHYSSRLDILAGTVDEMTGSVTHTSFVRCLASVSDLEVWVDRKADRAPHANVFGSSFVDW